MRAPVVALVALLVLVPTAAAATTADGECGYLGDWRAQALPFATAGPGLYPRLGTGACAMASAERTADGVRTVLRADVAMQREVTVLVRYAAFGTSTTHLACADLVCAVGPLEGRVRYDGPVCATIEVWQGQELRRAATACA